MPITVVQAMVVRFTWRRNEWREAWLLSKCEPRAHSGGMSMGYLLAGTMALGGIGKLVDTAISSGDSLMHDTLAPALLGIGLVVLLCIAALAVRKRTYRFRGMPPLPHEAQAVMVHERGWFATEAALPDAPPRPWSDLYGQRTGNSVITLLSRDGSVLGVPLRAMTRDQGDWLQRMVQRKSRPIHPA